MLNLNFLISLFGLICINSDVIVIYMGNVIFGVIYIWDFGGGIVIFGIGFGFYIVFWLIGGMKIIILSVSENGCSFM